jgi:hypothetical protein
VPVDRHRPLVTRAQAGAFRKSQPVERPELAASAVRRSVMAARRRDRLDFLNGYRHLVNGACPELGERSGILPSAVCARDVSVSPRRVVT